MSREISLCHCRLPRTQVLSCDLKTTSSILLTLLQKQWMLSCVLERLHTSMEDQFVSLALNFTTRHFAGCCRVAPPALRQSTELIYCQVPSCDLLYHESSKATTRHRQPHPVLDFPSCYSCSSEKCVSNWSLVTGVPSRVVRPCAAFSFPSAAVLSLTGWSCLAGFRPLTSHGLAHSVLDRNLHYLTWNFSG